MKKFGCFSDGDAVRGVRNDALCGGRDGSGGSRGAVRDDLRCDVRDGLRDGLRGASGAGWSSHFLLGFWNKYLILRHFLGGGKTFFCRQNPADEPPAETSSAGKFAGAMLPNVKEFRCFGSGGKEFFRRRGSADGLFLGGMMRRRVVPVFLFVAAVFAPLLVSADSTFSVHDEAASFFGDAGGQFEQRLRDEVLFGESSLDFSEWLKLRGAVGFDRVVTQPLVSGGEDFAEGFSFVRDVEVRYESPLGGRVGSFGVGALGSLRESADDVVVWELRGFVGEDDVAGANVGAAYRRLVSDNFLAGVNAFLDYERGGDDLADESFWRWSAGVEAVGRHLDFSANRYWALSDAVMATVGGEVFRVYSTDGWDAELRGRVAVRYPVAFRFLDSAEVAARYYVWEGDGTGGDADVSGARYRFGFVPLPQLRFGVEYDDGDGGGKHFGYYINFRHRLGGAADSLAGDDGVDVRSRRFDPVRREHQQHIMRVEATAMDLSLAVDDITVFLTSADSGLPVLTLDVVGGVLPYRVSLASAVPSDWVNSVTVNDSGVVSDAGAVAAGGSGEVVFVVSDAANMQVSATVKFSDLAVANDDVAVNVGGLSSGDVLMTLLNSGGNGARDYEFVSATRTEWTETSFSIDSNGVVTDVSALNAGGSGVVVFSVTDDDGFVRRVTVRLGDLSLSQTGFEVTLTSDDAGVSITALVASGGDGAVVYAVESVNPDSLRGLFTIDSDGVIRDNGAAVAGAATATIIFSVSDDGGFIVRATMTVAVLGDLSFVAGGGNNTVTLNSADDRVAVVTVIAGGGDGDYTYALVSTNPAGAALLLSDSATGVITDNGLAAAGAATVSAFVSVMDNFSAMMVTATVAFVVLDDVVFVDDNIRVTLDSDDGGIAVATLTASGGDENFIYARESAETFLAIDSDGVVSESGAVAAGAATASVVFSASDGEGTKVLATVHFVVLADLAFADDSVAVTLSSADDTAPVLTLTAVGGWLPRTYALVRTEPDNWGGGGNSLAIAADASGNGVVSDAGLAAAGAATVTAVFAVTDNIGAMASTTVTVFVLADLLLAEDTFAVTLTSDDADEVLLTLSVSGGDESYTYAVASADPSSYQNLLAIDSNGVVTDNGAAVAGAAAGGVAVTAIFTATDGNNTAVSATLDLLVIANLAVSNSSVSLALTFADAGAEVVTLSVSGGAAPYSYAVVSVNPSGRGDLFAVGSNGVITEAGVVTVGGPGTVIFSVTDAAGMVASATVEFNYTAVKFSARSQHAVAVLNGRMYVIGGALAGDSRVNDVWSSPDGVNWTQETAAAGFSARRSHSAAVLGGTIYIIGGDLVVGESNEVWASEDGANWTQQATPGFANRYSHSSAVLGGTLYVIAGLGASFSRLDDVWYTTNGTNWTVAVSVAAFPSRYEHSAEALDNTLFVMAGADTSFAILNAVWSSTDGAAYSQATSAAGFSVRRAYASAVLNGRIYVIGGFRTGGAGIRTNDVWSSDDGVTWTQDTSDAGFAVRSDHSAVVLNNRIYVMGGTDGTNIRNDVWSSADGVNWIQH